MYASKLGTMVAILATAAGFSAFAGSAQAQISGTIGGDVVDSDALQVSGNSDFTLTDGNVAFVWNRGKTNARVTGTIHVVDAEATRVRLSVVSFDRLDKQIGNASYDVSGGTGIHHEVQDIPVDMATTTAPYVKKIHVAVEMQGASDKWISKASTDTNLNLHDDSVTLLGDGIDVGSGPFGYAGPMLPATIAWKIGDDGKMTATYSGNEYFDGFSNCGRVVLRSLAVTTGFQVDELDGPKYCPADNGFYKDSRTLTTAATADANRVEVAMQSNNHGWADVASETVSIAE